MQLKQNLSFSKLESRRLIIGAVAGVAFASAFYFASIVVTHGAVSVMQGFPKSKVAGARASNELAREQGFPLRRVPEIAGSTDVETPAWAEPFWAGVAAAFGQAITLFIWFMRPQTPWSFWDKRVGLHVRASITTGLMWIAVVPLFVAELWFLYIILVYRGRVEASAFGHPVASDPFVSFGPSAALLVVLLALEPWRQLQLVYRCRWWPLLSVMFTLAMGAILFLAGRGFIALSTL